MKRIPLTVTWISVEHSLPQLGERVLVAIQDYGVFVYRTPLIGEKPWLPEGVTYWMTFPVAPHDVVLED